MAHNKYSICTDLKINVSKKSKENLTNPLKKAGMPFSIFGRVLINMGFNQLLASAEVKKEDYLENPERALEKMSEHLKLFLRVEKFNPFVHYEEEFKNDLDSFIKKVEENKRKNGD